MLADQRTSSPSPSRRISFGTKISALGAKLTRSLSRSETTLNEGVDDEETDSVSPVLQKPASERSLSRGREAFQSTGRGGLGNIRQTSKSRDARPNTGPDDFSVTRGREPINANQVFSTGRGGAGNLRSPSREPTAGKPSIDAREEEVIREYVAANEGAIRSSGRGGLGNFSDRSRSRDPASPPAVHSRSRSRDPGTPIRFSTGRGGAGNIQSGDGHIAEIIDEDERRVHRTPNEGIHSTGRGGAANLTSAHEPNIEQPPHWATEFESTGRGGAGNMVRDRSRSRQRD